MRIQSLSCPSEVTKGPNLSIECKVKTLGRPVRQMARLIFGSCSMHMSF